MAWIITEHTESPFEKAGRVYIEGENLVIRSDLDRRGFCILRADLQAILDGEARPVCLPESGEEAGGVRLSASGKAMNFTIGFFHYTIPLQSVLRILAGEQRKAPLFVRRQKGEGDCSISP